MKLAKLWIGTLALLFSSLSFAAVTYTYDNLNRLTNVNYGNGTSQAYTYDPAGNLRSINTVGAVGDTTPNPFSFTAQTGAALSSVATSNTITIAGINSAATISIVGGTYSINGGSYTAAAGSVSNGNTVTVRLTASASPSTLTTLTLTIGGVSGAFSVTTGATGAVKTNQTIGPITFSPATLAVGGSSTVSAIATSSLAVSFSTTSSACTATGINGKTITGIAAGTCVITASQGGNASYNAAPQSMQSITVAASAQTLPSAPTIGMATAGDASITVAFTPGAIGSGTLVNYTAICGNVTGTGTSSPITVGGLSNGTAYTCKVKTTSTAGVGPWSADSNVATPAANSVTNLLLNPGFESGASSWTEYSSLGYRIIGSVQGILAHTGNNMAYLGGADNATEYISQIVTIPAGAYPVSLQFWYNITTQESPGTPYDFMKVELYSVPSGAMLTTLASFSNLDKTTGWAQSAKLDMSAYRGMTVQLRFTATTDVSSPTSFYVDDVSLIQSNSAVKYDFNGDGKSDILWRNTTTGQNQIWFMNGAVKTSAADTTTAAAGWTVAGGADFNGDGKTDILWHNTAGQNAIWLMNGTALISGTAVSPVMAAPWTVGGTGDFNGDGKADILWRNTTTGANQIWLMNGAVKTSIVNPTTAAIAWTVVGVDDFNGDGKADILWRNAATGQDTVWLMNGAAVMAGSGPTGTLAAPWTIAGTGDFNGDGKSDILWRNPNNGQDTIWFMNGTAATGAITTTAAISWSVASVADFNGDGKTDILWCNAAGQNAIWLMNGAALSSSAALSPVMPAPWVVAK